MDKECYKYYSRGRGYIYGLHDYIIDLNGGDPGMGSRWFCKLEDQLGLDNSITGD